MARLEDLIAFQAMIGLLKDFNKEPMLETVYQAAKEEMKKPDTEAKNVVNVLYELFSTEQISAKIAALVKEESIQCGVDVIFQDVDKLHLACPKNLGDWYFTGDYPTLEETELPIKLSLILWKETSNALLKKFFYKPALD